MLVRVGGAAVGVAEGWSMRRHTSENTGRAGAVSRKAEECEEMRAKQMEGRCGRGK